MQVNSQEYGPITFTSSGGQDRILFDSFTSDSDVNPETGKAGIRRYTNKIAILVLNFFGYLTTIPTDDQSQNNDQKIIYVNAASLNQWRERYRKQMDENKLPSITEIIQWHRKQPPDITLRAIS